MNNYKHTLKNRLKLLIGLNVLAIACICATLWLSQTINNGEEMLNGMVTGFQVGIFFGLQMIMVIQIVRYRKALKNEQLLKAMQIHETDERSKWIQGKIGSTGFQISVGGILFTSILAGFFDQTVFLTLFGVTFFIVSVKFSLKIYYMNKY